MAGGLIMAVDNGATKAHVQVDARISCVGAGHDRVNTPSSRLSRLQ